jgi:hypothetical protein
MTQSMLRQRIGHLTYWFRDENVITKPVGSTKLAIHNGLSPEQALTSTKRIPPREAGCVGIVLDTVSTRLTTDFG